MSTTNSTEGNQARSAPAPAALGQQPMVDPYKEAARRRALREAQAKRASAAKKRKR